jgi:putative ABC transport system substrate-binding protein
MKRREFISLLGGAAAAWPVAARAQQQSVAFVGLLTGSQQDDRWLAALRQGLKETGYIEGRNVAIKHRSADGHFDRVPALAAELVADDVALIIAIAPSAALAAKAATTTIPIVFVTGADPIELGLVSSLSRPDANVTGVNFLVKTLAAKRLELLRELVPGATLIGFLFNPTNPASEPEIKDVQDASRALGLQLELLHASSERDIETAFASFAQRRINALLVAGDSFFLSRRDQLIAAAARHAIPTSYQLREFVAAGGLVSYGTDLIDAYRLAGVYAGRILEGERPTGLPVQQSVKFELVVNVKAANALGLQIPDKLLALADEVIE